MKERELEATLKKCKDNVHSLTTAAKASRKSISDSSHAAQKLREQLRRNAHALTLRTSELVSELFSIYPITKLPDGPNTCSIRGIHLPNSDYDNLPAAEEEKVAVGLGYVAHIVYMLSHFYNVTLRYPVKPMGSRASICDEIIHQSNKVEEYVPYTSRHLASLLTYSRSPLYLKGVEKQSFAYGVFLLNKNIEQLAYHRGFNVNPRYTLDNLRRLMELERQQLLLAKSKRPLSAS